METAVPGRLAHPERRGGAPWDPHGHGGSQTQEWPGHVCAFATFVPYAPHASAHPMCSPSKKKWFTSNGLFSMARISWDSPLGYVKDLCFKMPLWCFDLFLESVWSIYIEHGRPAPGRRQNELRRTRGVPLAPKTPTQRRLHQTEVGANRFGHVGCITGSWMPAPLHFPCALLVGYQQPAPRHHHDTDLAVSSHAARGTTPHPPAVGSPRSSHHTSRCRAFLMLSSIRLRVCLDGLFAGTSGSLAL